MPKKICLISDHHLSINPRLWKEAFLYEKMGFEVYILTMWQSDELLALDYEILSGHNITYKPFLDMRPGAVSFLERFFYRLRKRAGVELQKRLKIGVPWAISYAPERLLRLALNEKADIYSAHLECGFIVGCKLIDLRKKVSFDFEDWYSRDYLTLDRPVSMLTKLEKFALQNGAFCTAASNSMARSLAMNYFVNKEIVTIYNSFPESLSNKKIDNYTNNPNVKKMLWTSRTAGPGRGIETLVAALSLLDFPIDLHIIGKCVEGYENLIKKSLASTKHKVIFHDFVKHSALMESIQNFDIGLAIENNFPDNKNKTVSNKILQYIQAGLLVLATDTDGQAEVATYFPESVFLVKPDSPEIWKIALIKIIASLDKHDRERQKRLFQEIFSWDSQEMKLKKLINQYL